MTPLFTVVTVSIPERAYLLVEAMESVLAQSYGPVPHLIRIEEPDVFGTQHVTRQRNALLPAVQTPWIAVLDDDDQFEETYLERMAEAIEAHPDAAVVYSYCHGHEHAEGPFDGERLQRENYIDGEACISTTWLRAVGGYDDLPDRIVEDYALWLKIHALGGKFVCVPERLRYHGRAGRNITG
ncbi:MAG TPA: glycosyltransferase family A protein [Polyangia bacterium]|nr:glycosyltransferase family A protein [Polyangia bacterium]